VVKRKKGKRRRPLGKPKKKHRGEKSNSPASSAEAREAVQRNWRGDDSALAEGEE